MDFTSLVGRTIFSSNSEYVVEELLGSGAFGAVTLCTKEPSREKVAIKIIEDKESIKEAEEEANILHELKAFGPEEHHIVRFNGSFIFEGHFCLEFEQLDTDLYHFCDHRPLSLQQIRPIIKQMAEALCFLDFMGIVHADLKPENIMMVDRQRQPLKIRIIDFGLAIRKPVEWTGAPLQTLEFAAPEVLLGAPLSEAIDVWSVGCIAAELLLGTSLFHATNEYELMEHIVSTIGMPTEADMDLGLHTTTFFSKRFNVWTRETEGSSLCENSSRSPTSYLDAILTLPTHPEDGSPDEAVAAECDRDSFVDLVAKMLNLDPRLRITPWDIVMHPFLTMENLTGLCSSYLESSTELMEVCCKEGQHAGSSTTGAMSGPESSLSNRSQDLLEDSQSVSSRLQASSSERSDPMEGTSTNKKWSDPTEESSSDKRKRGKPPKNATSKKTRCKPSKDPSSHKRKRGKPSKKPSSKKRKW